MKKARTIIFRIALILLILVISGFGSARKRKFEITFHLNDIKSFAPSNQMAIWIEKPDSSLVKTLFLSEYLSYGGFNIKGICNEWSSKSHWSDVSTKEFDAVTSATPRIGDVKLNLEAPAGTIPDGMYMIFIEIHLSDEYNELYSGELTFTGKKNSCNLKVSYKPAKYPKKTEGDLLSDVQVQSR
jgi:hypothetical protein